jgi:indolepyruvate ferredoxin oxidoreductase
VSDSYCTKIKACPSFELVEVSQYHPTKYKKQNNHIEQREELPLPAIKKSLSDIANGSDYRLVVTGVGGSGVTTISRVLAEAAKKMGGRSDLDFKFVDQKGLAQRNGNVTSHLSIFKAGKSHCQITPLGGADLLLSPDLLDGSQHLTFLSSNGELILDESFQVPLSILLDKGSEKEPINELALNEKLKTTFGNRVSIYSFKKTSEENLGKNVYASAMLLGAAFQKGLLPFELDEMTEAFSKTMKKSELQFNLEAFRFGREMVLGKVLPKKITTQNEVELLKTSILESALLGGNTLVDLFLKNHKELISIFPNLNSAHLARFVHDLIIFDRGEKLNQFLSDARKISVQYRSLDLQSIALRTLAKTYFLKDEVYVSHIMISPMRRVEDVARYGELGSSFKKSFINRPSFNLGDKKVEFDISPNKPMLKLMRQARFLRKILPQWHKKERDIAQRIRSQLLDSTLTYQALKALENVKGYREERYKNAVHI